MSDIDAPPPAPGGNDPLSVALAWLAAVDRRDGEALIALSAPTIEVAGPRGAGGGRGALVAWFSRVAMSVKITRAFVRGGLVLIEHEAIWRDPDSGALVGEADTASIFTVADGLVSRYERDDAPAVTLRRGFVSADAVPVPA